MAALVGAGVGASRAHEPDEVDAAQSAIEQALASLDLALMLRDELRAVAPLPLVDCVGAVSAPTCACAPDTLLVIEISDVHAEMAGRIEPDVTLLIVAGAELREPGAAEPLYRRIWRYRGHEQDFFELAADDAALLRAEVEAAVTKLASAIATNLFVGEFAQDVERYSGDQPDGTVRTLEPLDWPNRLRERGVQQPPVAQSLPAKVAALPTS